MSIENTVSGVAAVQDATHQPLSRFKSIAAITIGNGLEFYDFVVYSFFATLIGRLYFPVSDPTGQLLLSFATFGVGFLMRPLGGLLIGMYADRAGRKPAVALTLWLMGLSSIIFVVTPTYAQVGMLAPIMILLARLVQGFAIGGEMGASTALLLEYADGRSRGFYTSWQPFSQGLAALFGALVGLFLSNVLEPAALEAWGWRAAFVIGILVIPVGLVIRRRLEETAPAATASESGSTMQLLREHRRALVASILLMIGVASSTYIVVYYLSNYAVSQLHMPLSLGIWAACVAAAVQVVLSPFAGWLSDRLGRRPVVLWSRVALLLMIYPAFVLINAEPSLTRLLVVVGCLSVPMSMTSPASMVLVSEVLPQRMRATGLSIAYCVAIAIFGGFAQFFSTELIHLTANPNAPAFYVIGCGLVSLIGLAMVPETLGRRLS
ncbi:major facilitator superfamily protein [Cupriavidus basilensis OR16]|uniref:Major facilitator superfamily protein n=1 Tax=Cupriavidus basilensis OR16 TaxID=1127483 RepID=H1S669_9BURK|nr:MFS transporter [Cupriavidus basilensis]EHP41893.1 major facilitator superfamily protein [Cupriavidus basilensis OR16]